jgi:hypothetical protein
MRLSTFALYVWAGILCPPVALAATLVLDADTLEGLQRIEVSTLDALANRPGSALDAYSVDQLDSDRGQVTLGPNKPFALSFNEPQSAFALTVGGSHAKAVLVLTLFRGEHETGRQVYAHRPIPGSHMAPIVDGRIGISADVPFDRVELRRVDGASQPDSLAVTSVLLAEPDNAALAALQSSGNAGALACIIPLGVAYNLSFFVALSPLPAAPTAGRAAFASNLALKFCKPSLSAPDDIERRVPAGQCAVELSQPHMAFGYQDALGIPLNSRSDWGELGTPRKTHHNTDVDVMLLAGNPRPPAARFTDLDFLLSSASFDASDKIWEDCRDDGSVRYSQLDGAGPQYECPYAVDRRLSFPVGDTTVVWRANPRLSPVDLLNAFIPGIPPGAKTDPWKTILLNVWRETAAIALDAQIDGWRLPNAQVDLQRIRVFDEIPPTITPMPGSQGNAVAELIGGVLHVTIEADEVGGVSRRRYEDVLRGFLQLDDACGRSTSLRAAFPTEALRSFWPVSTDTQDNSFEVTWTARDPGPNLAGNPNETVTTMRIEVLDRQPPTLIPPPDIVEIDSAQVTDLGQPALFDLVDLAPQVSNDAVLPLGLGLHPVTWTAVDAAGNTSQAVQIVNIKASNIAPVALAQTGASRPDAISFEPTLIRLRGSDPDGDPLRFKIEDRPENGFFVAPLYPYFIEDFRIEQSITDAELLAICTNGQGNDRNFHLEFPSEPEYLSVTDDGRTYVVDKGYIDCRAGSPVTLQREGRIAVFGNDGALLNARNIAADQLRDVVLDSGRDRVYLTSRDSSGSGVKVYNLDLDLQISYSLRNIRNRATGGTCTPGGLPQSGGGCTVLGATSALVDDNNLIYVLNSAGAILVLDGTLPPDFDCAVTPNCSHTATYIGTLNQDNSFTGNGNELALDADGRILAGRNSRVYRYTPSFIAGDSLAYPGELEGWLGRCDIDLAPGDQAVCDVANRRTLGFSCSDDICQVDESFNPEEQAICGDLGIGGQPRWGCRPGQLRGTPALDIAPDGTIYVADGGNARIQRFSSDGFFAGQARSTGAGSGFVIGDFGNPRNVSVNSSRFYILDPQTNLLHISLLTPFVEIGEDYADLVYQSTNQFACVNSADCIDRFSFRVSDGVRDPLSGQPEVSAPAEVEVEVSRNFRAPFANPGISVVVLEDMPTAVPLDGSDPDPLDTLSFEIVEPPSKGSVIIDGQNATFVPDADAFGEDSFSFRVSDGVFESAAEVVTIEIIELNDAPIISVPSEVIEGGTGYRVQLDLAFRDPDPDENHSVIINWGDGTIEPEGGFDAEGNPTGPILAHGGTNSGRITAEHIYPTAGMKTIEVCITDRMQPGPGDTEIPTPGLSLTGCESFAASISDGIDLGLSAVSSTEVALPAQFVSYQFQLENRPPQAGLGLTATGIELAIRLAQGFDPASISTPAGCSRNQWLLFCSVQNLSPGQSISLNISAQVATSTPSGVLLATEAEAFLDQTPVHPQLTLLLTTPVSRPADFQVGAIGDALKDEPDANPGDGLCATTAGACTLRAAVDEAATAVTPKVIALANSLYLLEDVLSISSDVTLIGNGPDQTRIHGARLNTQSGAGTLRIENLTLSGGGIRAAPLDTLIVRGVRFADNEIVSSFGGAIQTNAFMVDIRNSTFDNNRSTVDGGSLMCFSCSGVLENVTVSGGSGGGLTFTGTGEVALKHVTIVGTGGGSGWESPFGAALHVYDNMDVTIANSVLADNYSTGNAVNCAVSSNASLISLGNNAFGDLTGCTLTPLPSDQLPASIRLQPLSVGLDEMPVRRPDSDSPLIDAFDDSSCLPTDARGLPRPMDGNDDSIAACDIGAAERRAPAVFRDGFEGVPAAHGGSGSP